jgi:hypothetical protein
MSRELIVATIHCEKRFCSPLYFLVTSAVEMFMAAVAE